MRAVRVCLVRHGPAEDVGRTTRRTDRARPLTRAGRARTEAAARGLRAVKCRPQAIYTSPLLRARETAEILARVLGVPESVRVTDALEPGGAPERVVALLQRHPASSVVLVGHLPDLALLASHLVSAGGPVALQFKKAAALSVGFAGQVAAGAGCLEWLLQPAHLRRLGRRA